MKYELRSPLWGLLLIFWMIAAWALLIVAGYTWFALVGTGLLLIATWDAFRHMKQILP